MVRRERARGTRDQWYAVRSFLAIAMASSGLSVTLASTRLAEREIEAGRLVAPLAGRAVDVRYVGYHLVFPHANRQRVWCRRLPIGLWQSYR